MIPIDGFRLDYVKLIKGIQDQDPLHIFAQNVQDAASKSPTGWWGDRKVFINHAYDNYRKQTGDPIDIHSFKQKLLDAHNAGHLSLSRADLVDAMDPNDVQASGLPVYGKQYAAAYQSASGRDQLGMAQPHANFNFIAAPQHPSVAGKVQHSWSPGEQALLDRERAQQQSAPSTGPTQTGPKGGQYQLTPSGQKIYVGNTHTGKPITGPDENFMNLARTNHQKNDMPSGRKVVQAGHRHVKQNHKDFTPEEHTSAADLYRQLKDKHQNTPEGRAYHSLMYAHESASRGIKKAATGEHAAPAAAPTTGPAPSGPQGQPRQGHKYVKRWWSGEGWQYEYPGEGQVQQAHHPAHFGKEEMQSVQHPSGKVLSVPKREHVLQLPEGHGFGEGQEEQAYKETLASALKPGSQHTIPMPDGNGQFNITVDKKGHLYPTDQQGNPLLKDKKGKPAGFENHGQYERWYRTLQAGPVKLQDGSGKPWLDILPIVGRPGKDGFLEPAKAGEQRNWKIVTADGADPSLIEGLLGKSKGREVGYFISKDAAVAQADKLRQYIESKTGHQFGWGQQSQAQPPQQAQAVASFNDNPDPIVREMARHGWGVSADIESRKRGGAGARQGPMVRKFQGPPEVKERLVQQIAMQYSPKISAIVSNAIKTNPDLAKNPDYWSEKLLGGAALREGTVVSPEPGSLMHNAISRMVDKYDPASGVPIEGYISGSLVKDMLKQLTQARRESYATTSIDAGEQGKTQDIESPTMEEDTAEPSHLGGDYDPGKALDNWREMQKQSLAQLKAEKQLPKGFYEQALHAIDRISSDDEIDQFASVLHRFGHGDYLVDKALHKLLYMFGQELAKSTMAPPPNAFITKDKKVDPSHTYSHREGTEDHPRYYFRDGNGNFVRYTNGPSGHADASSRHGDPSVHSMEVDVQSAPQFFDLKGRKLTRAPYPGAEIQWNPNYHPQDPQNLWAGRWVNPVSGEHEYTYVDSDMRMIPKFYIHQQNMLVDVRLPVLRKYVRSLYDSPMLKDKIVSTILALLDQGHFRAQELTVLTVSDVKPQGALYQLGNRLVFGDNKFRQMMDLLTKNRQPQEPLFAVPFVKKNGEVDPMLIRRVGPHFIECLLDKLGLSLAALTTYHASQTFSRETQRLLTENQIPWESAIEYATVAVAQEMGHDLTAEAGLEQALPMIRELLIDPVMLEVLQQNAEELNLVGKQAVVLPLPPPPVMYISFDLLQRTSDEEEFSKWLHLYPFHTHAEEQQQAPISTPTQPNPPNSASTDSPQMEAVS